MSSNLPEGKMILFHGLSQEEISTVIKFIRTAIDPERTIACSMTVENTMDWNVRELIEHVIEEHDYMKKTASNNTQAY